MRNTRPRFGPVWWSWLREPAWLLLPLRGFLGVTFAYAGLQKLANPDYLDASSPTSAAAQMRLLERSSPVGPLVGLSTHAATLVGLLIAFGELAVGIGTLLGLHQRTAAAGGVLLSVTFFLTVSWNTRPYYYGSDIVFAFAWLTLLGFGSGGVLDLQRRVRERARASLRLAPEPAEVAVSASRLRTLCPRAGRCGLRPDGLCARRYGCPVLPAEEHLPSRDRAELERRTMVRAGTATLHAASGALVLGGAAAVLGRVVGGTRHHTATLRAGSPPQARPGSQTPGRAGSTTPAPPSGGATPAGGTVVGTAAGVPVGQARQFTDPATRRPAWMVHPSGSIFVASDAACTHAGCPVQFDPDGMRFVCPCHGGVFDARTGKVLHGPPPTPLQAIPVRVAAGQLRVDQ